MSTTKVCIQCGAVYDVGQKFCPNDGSPLRLQNADDPLIGQLVADRYQVISLIGEGGMGRVYCAEHVRMGRKSAVKVINPALATTSDAIARFNREAANACRINHPNVAQVYDFGEMADGTLYLAMEYVDGETLDAIIAREGSLRVQRAAHITKQVADALYAAHHLDIVHRDLKPENVMLARHLDGTDWVKVVDFGIAKTVQRDGGGSQTVTTAGVSLGTPEYMSPEQLAGERLDHRTDIYSLGLVLFNMLTGELPYPKVTSKETLVRRLTSKPRTLAEVRPDVAWPAGLQAALDCAVAPVLADRYDSVADFGRDVAKAAADAPAELGPPVLLPETRRREAPSSMSAAASPEDGRVGARGSYRRTVPWLIAGASLLVAGAVFATRTRETEPNPDIGVAVGSADSESRAPMVRVPEPPSSAAPRAAAPAPERRRGATQAGVGATSDSALDAASRGLRMADSATRAAIGVEFGRLVNLDSILARVRPELQRAQRDAQRGTHANLTNRHYWLRAGGDSAAARPLPRSAPLEARVGAAGDEVHAHIARMHRFFDAGNVRAARVELSNATTEVAVLRQVAPTSPVVMELEQALNEGVRDLVVACYRKQADSTLARGVRCESLVGGAFNRTWVSPPRPQPR